MYARKGLICILLFPLTFVNAYGKEIIGFKSYISAISNKLTEIKINLIKLEEASNTYYQAFSGGDTALSASAGVTADYASSNTGAVVIDSSYIQFLDAGVSKKLLDTGTTFSAGISYSQIYAKAHTLNLPQTSADFNLGSPSVVLSVSQPLLRNRFGIADRYRIKDAKMSRDMQELQTESDGQKILSSYEILYFQWIGQLKTLAFLSESLSNADMSEKQSRARFKAALIDNDDYQSTKNLYLQYFSSYITYEQALKATSTQLAYYFDISSAVPDQNEWDLVLTNAIGTEFTEVAFEKTKSAKLLTLAGKRLEEAVEIGRNQMLPDLSLYGSLSFSGIGSNTGMILSNTVSSPSAAVGLNLSFPLENTDEKSSLKDKELALQSHNLEWIKTKQDYEIKLKNFIDGVNTKKKILENTQASLIALNSMYATQKIRHSQGRLDQNTLNDTLIKIAAGEISLVECQYGLISLYIDYKTLTF